MKHYDVIVIGAGPGGIFATYELAKKNPDLSIGVFEAGHRLSDRKCPIDGDKIPTCIKCKSCSIMSGFGGAGAFSDGKYNITNDFGGTLYEYIGKQQAIELMKYVDEINMEHGGEGTRLFSTAGTQFKKICMQNKLKLLDASVRHLGTDINYVVLENLYNELKEKADFHFDTPVVSINRTAAVNGWKKYVMKWTSLLNQTVLTSVSVLNFLPLFFHILQMNYTRVKSYTGHSSLKIMSVLSV